MLTLKPPQMTVNLEHYLNICSHHISLMMFRLYLQPIIYLVVGFLYRAYCWCNSLISRWTFLIHSLKNTGSSSAANCLINRSMFIRCPCNYPHLPLKHYCFKEPINHRIYFFFWRPPPFLYKKGGGGPNRKTIKHINL